MKKTLRLLICGILFPCMIFLTACSKSDVYQSAVNNGLDLLSEQEMIEAIKGEDGKNGIDGRDGKDGNNIDLYEVYQKIVELGEFSGSFSEFVKEYLSKTPSILASSTALKSAVSVYAGFTQDIAYKDKNNNDCVFEYKHYSAGSGVIYSLDSDAGDAYIITNYHVIYDNEADNPISQEVSVFVYGKEDGYVEEVDSITLSTGFWQDTTFTHEELRGESKISAKVIGGSLQYDIAVLKVTNNPILKQKNNSAVNLGSYEDICVGEDVIAVGNPSALKLSVTSGTICVDSEYISMLGVDNQTRCRFRVLRTDTAINAGNSGGGLFNKDGNLIGIVNAKITHATVENIGYAIPINIVVNVANNIIRNCNGEDKLCVKKPILGITLAAKDSYAQYDPTTLKTTMIETVEVYLIEQNSICVGLLEVGDIITSVSINYLSGKSINQNITRHFQLSDLCLTLSEGDEIIFKRTASDGSLKSDVNITITQSLIVDYK